MIVVPAWAVALFFAGCAALAACFVYPIACYMPHPYGNVAAVDVSAAAAARFPDGLSFKDGLHPTFTPNSRLKSTGSLFEGRVSGAESVAVDSSGALLLLDRFGDLHRAKPGSDQAEPAGFWGGAGRPLGFHHVVEPGGGKALLVANSVVGLLRMDLESGSIRLLSNRVSRGPKLAYFNDLDVARNGTVFFTCSTEGAVSLGPAGYYDTLRSYLLNLLRGDASGRLLAYDPTDGSTRVLMDNLFYANGVAVAPDQSYVAVVETSAFRVHRYWLAGPRAGTSEVLIEGLPALPDGISASADGHLWLALVAGVTRLPRMIMGHRLLRQLGSHLLVSRPHLLLRPFGGVLKLELESGRVLEQMYDMEGEVARSISAVTEAPGGSHGGSRLYFGNLLGTGIGSLEL